MKKFSEDLTISGIEEFLEIEKTNAEDWRKFFDQLNNKQKSDI
jgi:hypothetical protein